VSGTGGLGSPREASAGLATDGVTSRRRLGAEVLIVLGLSLGGCTKCGWIWDDLGRACKAELPK